MNKQYKFLDLFAGCGGFSLGLKWAGFEPVWAVEIDADAVETYKTNIAPHIVCADVRDIETSIVPQVNLLVGGFPCQPFSISGLQHGFFGKDGDLFYQCSRFIHDLQPEVFVLENVPGFIKLKKGAFLREALSVLQSLGYFVSWKVINTVDYNIPQVRQRLFIIGNRLGRDNDFPTPGASRISVKEAIEDIRQNMESYQNNIPMRHTDRIKKRFRAVQPGESAIHAMERDPSLGDAKITKQCYRRLIPDEPAPTIVANFVTTTIHYSEDRNLTSREAARLQSFPDDFIFKGRKTRMSWQRGLSQFEQIGNAVPPKLAEQLGYSIRRILEGRTEIIANRQYNEELADQLTMFSHDISQVSSELHPQKQPNRGRKSKYASIYSSIENLPLGESLELNESVPGEFFVFLKGAMRRRGIQYTVLESNNGNTTIMRLG